MCNIFKNIFGSVNVVLVLVVLCFAAGCNKPETEEVDCQSQVEDLQGQLKQAKMLLKQKDQQIENLQNLPADYLKDITSAHKIDLGRYTRFEDTNGDTNADTLMVYLNISDKHGDKVKVGGVCIIELWDLDAPEDRNLVKTWVFTPSEFEKHWDGILGASYRFKLSLGEYKMSKDSLTIKCKYKELLTGEVFEIQKLVNIRRVTSI